MNDTLVLCYHALSAAWAADLSVAPDAFRDQMKRLERAGYRGITFSEAVRGAHGKQVAVTFDDAFASVLALAKPTLDEIGFPATVYAVTQFAREGTPLRWDGVSHWAEGPHADELASLDWDALRGLRDDGWEIGSHTVTHPDLTALDDDQLDRELNDSREAVAAAMGEPCTSIAYPYGRVDARVIAAAGRAGYATGAALPARWGRRSALEWPRVGIYHPDGPGRVRLKTSRATRRAREALRR